MLFGGGGVLHLWDESHMRISIRLTLDAAYKRVYHVLLDHYQAQSPIYLRAPWIDSLRLT